MLILAALMASMVGAAAALPAAAAGRRRCVALGASVVTWIVAQTVLGSLAG